jgi:hypothetical protein
MALKKFIRVTLVDKTVVDIDLKDPIRLALEAHPPAITFNAPANDQFFFRMAQNISLYGLIDEKINDTYMKMVPPSQIQSVEIIFENSKLEIVKN